MKEAKLGELEKRSSSIDTKTAKSAQLKREVAELQISLDQKSASQAAVTKLRAEEMEAKGGLAESPRKMRVPHCEERPGAAHSRMDHVCFEVWR